MVFGMSYRLNDVYFAFNAYDLPQESRMVIGEFYRFLYDNPTLKVSIEGHTDNIGQEEDNLLLSQRRAKAVYDHLISLGIEPARLAYKGFGESRPIATNQTDDGRAKNRRVEFKVLSK